VAKGIFISHAGDDARFARAFVDTVIRLGCEVDRKSIFYSSGSAEGVPAGVNLSAYIRKKLSDVALVVAIVTPRFKERPYCLAELGAAWSRTDNLVPLIAGLELDDLDGVLKGLKIGRMNSAADLAHLHRRVTQALSIEGDAPTWTEYSKQWLEEFPKHAGKIAAARSTSATSVASLSRAGGHMDVLWTDAKGAVWYRRWENDSWSDPHRMDGVEADWVTAVSVNPADAGDGAILFGVRGTNRVWLRRWRSSARGGPPQPGKVEWITGRTKVAGPLTALRHDGGDIELVARTAKGEECHTWRDGERWRTWTTRW
jgi:hypothetical protein